MHKHYKGTGRVHSFRGLLTGGGVTGTQDEINIEGSVGAIAWRVTKFEIMDGAPGTLNTENIVKIYREEQSTIDGVVNFKDDELLGVGVWVFNASNPQYSTTSAVIFDSALFVRNIWVTHKEVSGNDNSCNYYIELEEVTVSAAGKAQLALAAARRTGDR